VAIVGPAGAVVPGQPVTITAAVAPVAPGTGVPTGTVTFTDNGADIGCANVSLVAAQAQCSTTWSAVGTHTIAVSHSGDPTFPGSGATPLGVQVVPATTSPALVAPAEPLLTGQAVSYTATVSATPPATATPGGNVAFLDGANAIAACTSVPV